jgi:hypothetical protein
MQLERFRHERIDLTLLVVRIRVLSFRRHAGAYRDLGDDRRPKHAALPLAGSDPEQNGG